MIFQPRQRLTAALLNAAFADVARGQLTMDEAYFATSAAGRVTFAPVIAADITQSGSYNAQFGGLTVLAGAVIEGGGLVVSDGGLRILNTGGGTELDVGPLTVSGALVEVVNGTLGLRAALVQVMAPGTDETMTMLYGGSGLTGPMRKVAVGSGLTLTADGTLNNTGSNAAVTNQATVTIEAGATLTLSGAQVAGTVVALIGGDATIVMSDVAEITFRPITQRAALPALSGATWNPGDMTGQCSLSGGNLVASNPSSESSWAFVRATTAVAAGQDKYFEFLLNNVNGQDFLFGLAPSGALQSAPGVPAGVGWGRDQSANPAYEYLSNTLSAASYLPLASIATGKVIGAFVRRTVGKVWLRDSNGWIGAAGNGSSGAKQDPYTNAGGFDISSLGTVALYPSVGMYRATSQITANFDGAFVYDGGPATLTVRTGSGSVAFTTTRRVTANGAYGLDTV